MIVEIFSIHHCDITSKILRGARMFKQHIRTRKICRTQRCFEKVALISNEVHKKLFAWNSDRFMCLKHLIFHQSKRRPEMSCLEKSKVFIKAHCQAGSWSGQKGGVTWRLYKLYGEPTATKNAFILIGRCDSSPFLTKHTHCTLRQLLDINLWQGLGAYLSWIMAGTATWP